MKSVLFHAPTSLNEALDLLSEFGDRATLLAGGTDVVVDINRRRLSPKVLVSLGEIHDLDFIKDDATALCIGAMTTHDSIATSPRVKKWAPLLAQACGTVGGPNIRNIATVGGNVVTASPGADSAVALLALNAEVTLMSARDQRKLPLRDFFTGPGRTVRRGDEILVGLTVPHPPEGTSGDFQRQGRRKADCLGVAIAAVTLRCQEGVCQEAAIALGAVGPRPFRAAVAEDYLRGKKVDVATIKESATLAAEATQPRDSGRGATWYKKRLSGVLVQRALANAAGLDLDQGQAPFDH